MSALRKTHTDVISVNEYLAAEREAFERSEYFDGIVVAMAGESDAHAFITMNLAGLIHAILKGKNCHGRTKDTKVRSGPAKPFSRVNSKGMFSYPDLVVICGEAEHYDDSKDVILNPKVIFEVLSPSTENYDRGRKFENYRIWNATLADYLLISQSKPHVEHHRRLPDDDWHMKETRSLDGEIKIASLDCTLKLSDIYDRVEFPSGKVERKKKAKGKK